MGCLLVPLDGSKRAEAALLPAAALAKEEELPLLLVHSVPTSSGISRGAAVLRDRERRRGSAYLDRMCARMHSLGVQATARVLPGEASVVVVRLAVREACTLIVLSGRGQGGGEGPLGSVAERILQTSPVPVLLIRGPRRFFRTVLVPLDCPLELVARAGRLVRALRAEAALVGHVARTTAGLTRTRAVMDVLTRLGVPVREIDHSPVPEGKVPVLVRTLESPLIVLPNRGLASDPGRRMANLLREPALSILMAPGL
jgi:nucleotide-binding universal stress UspA family protein